MSNQSGRGKQSFREFTKQANQLKREIITAIKEGNDFTTADITHQFTVLENEYEGYLKEQELDVRFWGDRAIDYSLTKETEIITRFDLSEPDAQQEDREANEPDDDPENEPDPDESDDTISGYPIITRENRNFYRRLGKPRKRILVDKEDLEEYIQGVPYILAIQILRRSDNSVLGFRVWVDKQKDKYKRKKSS